LASLLDEVAARKVRALKLKVEIIGLPHYGLISATESGTEWSAGEVSPRLA
jgi:hypothetical protein